MNLDEIERLLQVADVAALNDNRETITFIQSLFVKSLSGYISPHPASGDFVSKRNVIENAFFSHYKNVRRTKTVLSHEDLSKLIYSIMHN